MGILDALFGKSGAGPSERQVAAAVKTLEFRHGEPARRYEAAERLAKWDTPEATSALLKRFTFNAESTTSDEEEKAHVADLVAGKGAAAVAPVLQYLRTEGEVGWALRVLERLLPADQVRDRVLDLLCELDVLFDREPQRKVDLIRSLSDHRSEPRVPEVVARFLEDTDDRVRIAAVELLAACGRSEDHERLIDALVAAEDRPRVKSALLASMAEHGVVARGRKAEVEPLLPAGYYLTREGAVKRLGRAEP
jgi:hypothetical protein